MKRWIHASDTLRFDYREGLGLNNPVLKLSNGDEIVLDLSYADRGDNLHSLPLDEGMDEHFTDDFLFKGVGSKEYLVTREVTIYSRDANIRGGRFKSKIVNVEEI